MVHKIHYSIEKYGTFEEHNFSSVIIKILKLMMRLFKYGGQKIEKNVNK